jgi:hypothetical protein
LVQKQENLLPKKKARKFSFRSIWNMYIYPKKREISAFYQEREEKNSGLSSIMHYPILSELIDYSIVRPLFGFVQFCLVNLDLFSWIGFVQIGSLCFNISCFRLVEFGFGYSYFRCL